MLFDDFQRSETSAATRSAHARFDGCERSAALLRDHQNSIRAPARCLAIDKRFGPRTRFWASAATRSAPARCPGCEEMVSLLQLAAVRPAPSASTVALLVIDKRFACGATRGLPPQGASMLASTASRRGHFFGITVALSRDRQNLWPSHPVQGVCRAPSASPATCLMIDKCFGIRSRFKELAQYGASILVSTA